MATLSTNLKVWGSVGQEFPDNYNYLEGEQPVDAWDNYFNYNVISDIQTLIDRINAIDSDGDAVVDKADTANLYKNNDIDSDGDGIVDIADYANDGNASTYKGNDIDSDGDGKVNAAVEADNTQTVKGSNLDFDSHSIEDSGTVKAGDAGILFQTELADGESFNLYQYTFTKADGSPAPSGLYLCLITLDGSGGSTLQSNVVAGDAPDLFIDETGTPVDSYTNTSGGPQTIAFAVDNGQFNGGSGSDTDMYTSTNVRIE